jgi:hypothetical protein
LFESVIFGSTLCQRFACGHAAHVSLLRDVTPDPCDCMLRSATPLLPAA